MAFTLRSDVNRPLNYSEADANWTQLETLHAETLAARDVAISDTILYPDTTAGLAATAEGGYFVVPDTAADQLVYYRKETGAAVEKVRIGNRLPLDATLTSLSALGTAANKMAYTTGVDTWAETAITAAGRALLDDASAAAQLTTLGTTAFNTFVSADQVITPGGALTLAHGLGAMPRLTSVRLVCQTAELGYAVGDIVQVEGDAASCVPGSTNLNIRYLTTSILIINKSSGSSSVITLANWNARFFAIK